MAKWFRSEPMEYISLIVNEDGAHDCLADLGKLSVIQFTDLNPDLTPFQRRYVSYVKRCDELERKLRFFQHEVEKFALPLESAGSMDDFIENNHCGDAAMRNNSSGTSTTAISSSLLTGVTKTGGQLLEVLENELEDYESNLLELNMMGQRLTIEFNEKVELQEVLEKARKWYTLDKARLENFSSKKSSIKKNILRNRPSSSSLSSLGSMSSSSLSNQQATLLPSSNEDGEHPLNNDRLRFSFISGVVKNEEKNRFERMVFRTTRGNCYLRFAEIEEPLTDPVTGQYVQKSVFIVFYKSESIEKKLNKICDAFSAHRYIIPSPDNTEAIDLNLEENMQDLMDSQKILLTNQYTRYRLCTLLAAHNERWTWIVLREKAIYHTLNMFKVDVRGMLRGEGWVVKESFSAVKEAVEHSAMTSIIDHVPKPWPTPPTHFQTNKFTYGYQEFVNTYGIPRYREANPALFTAATFPFLFGIMYGDVGHGLFLFCFGLYLLWNEKENDTKKLGEMMDGMHAARYMITMMGFFAIYAGFMYNDCFSLGLGLFESRWVFPGEEYGTLEEGSIAEPISEYSTGESVYPFGLDPIWHATSNELLFFNSFKMKLSVIFGIIQMFAGTCLKGLNAAYFKNKIDLFCEFVPMVIFAASLFVYMVFLIFYKWCVDWHSRMLSATCIDPESDTWGSEAYKGEWVKCDESAGDGFCTPWGYACTGSEDLVTKCPLDLGGSGDGCQPPNLITTLINIALQPGAVEEPMFAGQAGLQQILLLLALVSVPVLLFAKPYFLSKKHALSHQKPVPVMVYPTVDGEVESGGTQPQQAAAVAHTSNTNKKEDEQQHSFSEILIHQAIETIEFILGMISNTASYLRLWALSLAHNQLATVFWEKALLSTLNTNWLATYFGFALFAGITFGILLCMDVLECFLHALRLHWVEFQNKFYFADGIRFSPYSFKQIIKNH